MKPTGVPTREVVRGTAPSKVAKGAGLFQAVRAELMKLLSLRSLRWLLVASFILAGVLGLYVTKVLGSNTYKEFSTLQVLNGPVAIATIIVGLLVTVIGVIAITNEYTSGMILSSMTAVPKRGVFFAAKFLAVFLLTLIVSILFVTMLVIFAGMERPELFTMITEDEFSSVILALPVALIFLAFFGMGVGFLLRGSASAITTSLGLIYMLPFLFLIGERINLTWVSKLHDFIIWTSLERMLAGVEPDTTSDGMTYLQSMGIFALWVVIPLVIGAILFHRRDAK